MVCLNKFAPPSSLNLNLEKSYKMLADTSKYVELEKHVGVLIWKEVMKYV